MGSRVVFVVWYPRGGGSSGTQRDAGAAEPAAKLALHDGGSGRSDHHPAVGPLLDLDKVDVVTGGLLDLFGHIGSPLGLGLGDDLGNAWIDNPVSIGPEARRGLHGGHGHLQTRFADGMTFLTLTLALKNSHILTFL